MSSAPLDCRLWRTDNVCLTLIVFCWKLIGACQISASTVDTGYHSQYMTSWHAPIPLGECLI